MGSRTVSPGTEEVAKLLGSRIRLARRERKWTVTELAARLGVVETTVRKVERGDLSVAIGTAFEAAWLTGVVLFDENSPRRRLELARVEDRLALLPQSVRRKVVDDDF